MKKLLFDAYCLYIQRKCVTLQPYYVKNLNQKNHYK